MVHSSPFRDSRIVLYIFQFYLCTLHNILSVHTYLASPVSCYVRTLLPFRLVRHILRIFYCVIRCAYRHPASVTYMLPHFIHLPQCSLSFTSFYVYYAVFYRAPSAMSFYSNIVATTQAGSACSVDARPALVPIFIQSCFLAPNFFFSQGSPFSSDCCHPAFAGGNLYQPVVFCDTITGKCKLFYFLCHPIQ